MSNLLLALLCAASLVIADVSAGCTSAADCTTEISTPITGSQQSPLTYCPQSTIKNAWGANPCSSPNSSCKTITNTYLKDAMVTRNVGPFSVTGIKCAVDALQRALDNLYWDNPTLYNMLGTAGMTCCRLISGSTSYSNHAWGTAVDIKINNQLDTYGNNMVQRGLYELYDYMHAQGFFWGATFSNGEDAMHFELASQTVTDWKDSGRLYDGVTCKTSSGVSGFCKNSADCTGSAVSGLCPGGSNIKCCINAPQTCWAVDGRKGECKAASACTWPYVPMANMCKSSGQQCCVPYYG